MIVELLAEHHLEFLSLKGGCRGSSESSLVKISWRGSIFGENGIYCLPQRVGLKVVDK